MITKGTPAKSTPRTGGKAAINFAAAYTDLNAIATQATSDRFKRAEQIVAQQPSALTPPPAAGPDAAVVHVPSREEQTTAYVIGKVYPIPIGLIDPNRVGVRHHYNVSDVDTIGNSMSVGGQMVAANGFVKPDGRIELIDGGTRWRSAKSRGLSTLDVKIEKAPENAREQFKRSVQIHDERNDHTAIDLAVSYAHLLAQQVYASQDDLAKDMTDKKGSPMSKAQLSMYLRIATIPERLRRQMLEHEQTRGFHVAYEVSALFNQNDFKDRSDEYERMAEEVIKEIQDRGLGKVQAASLIKSKLNGKQSRTRGAVVAVKFGDKQGVIKTFIARGQLDFTIKSLSPEKLQELSEAIQRVCSGQPSL